YDVVDVEPAPLHRVGELVEDQQVVALVGQAALDLLPSLQSRGLVVLGVTLLSGPRPAGTHLVPLDRAALARLLVQPAQSLQNGLLADAPLGRLHELEDTDPPALGPRAKRQAQGGGGLPRA